MDSSVPHVLRFQTRLKLLVPNMNACVAHSHQMFCIASDIFPDYCLKTNLLSVSEFRMLKEYILTSKPTCRMYVNCTQNPWTIAHSLLLFVVANVRCLSATVVAMYHCMQLMASHQH